MKHDLVNRVQWDAEELSGPVAHEFVRCAMESIPSNPPSRGQFPVDRIGGRGSRKVVEERRVEHRDMRHVGQYLPGHLNTQHRRRIVQRCQRRQVTQRVDQFVVNNRWPVQAGSTMHNPMPHSD